MKAYALDLRQKILRAYEQRLGSPRAIAALLGVSPSLVEKLRRRRRTTGDLAPRRHAGGRRALCHEPALAGIRRLVQGHPDATFAELCARPVAQQGLRVSVPTRGRLGIALSLPRKKRRSPPADRAPSVSSRHERPITREERRSIPSASSSSMDRA